MAATSGNTRNIKFFWIVKLFGLALFIYLLLTIDRQAIGSLFYKIDLFLLISAILLTKIALNFFKVLRWHLILKWMGVKYNFWQTYITYQAAIFLGLMTPGRFGEMFRSVYLKSDHDVPISAGIATVGTDRVFDLFGMLLLAGFALLINPQYGATRNAGWYFLAGALIAGILLAIVRHVSPEKLKKISIFGNHFVGDLLAAFSSQIRMMDVRRMVFQIVNTIVATIIFAYICELLAKSINIEIDMITAGGIAAAANLVMVIPVTFYGLGTREITIITLMGFLGITQPEAFSFSLLIFLNFWIIAALWGMIFWLLKPMKLKRAKKLGAER